MEMEFQFWFSLTFLLSPTLIIILLKLIVSRSSNTDITNKKLPPHPWIKLPVIGHMHYLFGTQSPHRALSNLADKLGPIMYLQLGEISTLVISSPSAAKQIMKTHDICFASRPKFPSAQILLYDYKDIAFAPYGDYWREMRKICVLELLSARKVNSFRSIREQESWNLVESIVESITIHGSVVIDLTELILSMTNTITCRVSIGNKCKDQARLIALMKEGVDLMSGFYVSDLFPSLGILPGNKKRLLKVHKEADEILENIIIDNVERRCSGIQSGKEENEALIDVLLRLKDDGGSQFPLTYDHIKAVIIDMFVGGTDTASVTIVWAMSELIKNPTLMKRAQDDIRQSLNGKKKVEESDIQQLKYLKLVIMETLRLHPPGPALVPRECRETCQINGYHIPLNTKVLINTWKIGRDPNYWTDPESFIPDRFTESSYEMNTTNYEYIPFGGGRRVCPGIKMGLANIELTLALLLYHFNWDLPDGAKSEDLDMTESFGTVLKRKHNLLLVPSPYNIN